MEKALLADVADVTCTCRAVVTTKTAESHRGDGELADDRDKERVDVVTNVFHTSTNIHVSLQKRKARGGDHRR